jgi:hypothetical protein
MPNRAEIADDRETAEGMKHICRAIVLESGVQTRPRRFLYVHSKYNWSILPSRDVDLYSHRSCYNTSKIAVRLSIMQGLQPLSTCHAMVCSTMSSSLALPRMSTKLNCAIPACHASDPGSIIIVCHDVLLLAVLFVFICS